MSDFSRLNTNFMLILVSLNLHFCWNLILFKNVFAFFFSYFFCTLHDPDTHGIKHDLNTPPRLAKDQQDSTAAAIIAFSALFSSELESVVCLELHAHRSHVVQVCDC